MEKTGKVRLFVALGRKNDMTPEKLVEMVTSKTKVDERKLKNVEVYENFSFYLFLSKKQKKLLKYSTQEEKRKKTFNRKS